MEYIVAIWNKFPQVLGDIVKAESIVDVSVYCIPCKICKLKYFDETSRNIHKRLNDHRKDISVGNLNNALLQHNSKLDHNFDFNAATMLVYIHNKRLRWIFEAGAIPVYPSKTTDPVFTISSRIWGNLF